MSERNLWRNKVAEFVSEFNAHPDWTLKQVAEHLNTSVPTASKILTVSKHMDNLKIHNSVTLNQAYYKIQQLYKDERSELDNEIASILNGTK